MREQIAQEQSVPVLGSTPEPWDPDGMQGCVHGRTDLRRCRALGRPRLTHTTDLMLWLIFLLSE